MATGETGFDDVAFDLVSVQYHALKAGHEWSRTTGQTMAQNLFAVAHALGNTPIPKP